MQVSISIIQVSIPMNWIVADRLWTYGSRTKAKTNRIISGFVTICSNTQTSSAVWCDSHIFTVDNELLLIYLRIIGIKYNVEYWDDSRWLFLKCSVLVWYSCCSSFVCYFFSDLSRIVCDGFCGVGRTKYIWIYSEFSDFSAASFQQ